ncbi:hypothetical protein GCM10018793_69120 [Streptomyces sulfonofaciens]|uniref:Oxidoreductase n=1 Tax=Streptomyces sulfonofaciens TaxID=68272 RepID=A0A919GRD6_9ACTN|nr:Gfo/Idh/MocA family oxidoreductase [Streptomyces sulfonofaciens]GHH88666.1 hypothetical protein GCM10018793_69120 [Streptomyces sulfonofaciens]
MDVALIGAGRGAVHAKWLSAVPGFRVAGIACATQAAAAGLAREHPGAQAGTDPLALIRRAGLGGVVVATPTHAHAELVTEALRRDLFVVCEVPLAADPRTALGLAELATARYSRAYTPFQWRENEALRQARAALLAGDVGELVAVDLALHDDSHVGPRTRWPWRQRRDTAGGALAELGVHAFDLLRWATGNPTWEVRSAWTHRVLDTRQGPGGPVEVDVDDLAQAELRPLGQAARGRVAVSRISPEPRRLEAVLTGSRGVIRVTADGTDGSAVLTLTTGARSLRRQTGPQDMNPYKRLAEDIATGIDTAPTFDDGLAAVHLVHTAVAAARRREV